MSEPCCVPNCYRRAKKDLPFCERCWACASDEERAGVLFAARAPFFRRYEQFQVGDVQVIELGRPLSVENRHGYAALHGRYIGEFLREFEARTTREAVALAIVARRRLGNELMREAEDA